MLKNNICTAQIFLNMCMFFCVENINAACYGGLAEISANIRAVSLQNKIVCVVCGVFSVVKLFSNTNLVGCFVNFTNKRGGRCEICDVCCLFFTNNQHKYKWF